LKVNPRLRAIINALDAKFLKLLRTDELFASHLYGYTYVAVWGEDRRGLMLQFRKQTKIAPPAAGTIHRNVRTIPEKTAILRTGPDDTESPEIRAIYDIWNQMRGERPMPTREELLPRALGRLLRNVSLARVLPETNDYELRIIGDAHAEAYGWNGKGLRVSQLISGAPEMGTMLKDSYDLVRTFRLPLGFRGILGRDITQAKFDWFETLYLPLGSGGVVDHVLNASNYRPKDGKWPH
jgi:hypothetical protein